MPKKEAEQMTIEYKKEWNTKDGICPFCGWLIYCGARSHFVEEKYGKEKAREYDNHYWIKPFSQEHLKEMVLKGEIKRSLVEYDE